MKHCKYCGKELPSNKKRNIFCNKSCAASYNNKGIRRHGNPPQKEFKCIFCGKDYIGSRKNKGLYCSSKCQKDYEYESYIELWKNDEIDGSIKNSRVSKHIRRYLFEKYDGKCSRCGWDTPNPYIGKVILEIEHIDGNSTNNIEGNLDLICPNCHSLTSTYKALNYGNGNRIRLKYSKLI